jgi:adenosylcobinamide kinase/adenosylcobinamide-phosphate guanylyltransferase
MSIKGNPDAACDTALGIGSISGPAAVAATGSSDATIGGHPEITTDGDSGRTEGGMGAKKPVGRGLPGKDHLPGKGHLPGKDHLPGEGSCGPAIILVTGGFCQGKTAFAGSKAATMKQTGMERIVIVDDYQEHVRCRLLQEMKHEGEREAPGRSTGQRESGLGYGEELALELLNKLEDEGASAAIVVSALPCAGPVPADLFERRWRDEVGKACQVLAAHSAEVYRVLCGIPQRLK